MQYLFKKFNQLTLHNNNKDIYNIYNYFISQLNDEESKFVSDHFMLFLKTAECSRNAISEIQSKILMS